MPESDVVHYRKVLPKHTQVAIDNYVVRGIAPGGFLRSVLDNDLYGAVVLADSQNLKALKDIAQFFRNYVPDVCKGDKHCVDNWCQYKGLEGRGALIPSGYVPLVTNFKEPDAQPDELKTVKEAVKWLRKHWNKAAFKEILGMPLPSLHNSAGKWIRNNMGLWLDNTALLEDADKYYKGPRVVDCSMVTTEMGVTHTEDGRLHPDVASSIILGELKKLLEAERDK